MWQSPNQRLKAVASARKRERERRRQPLHLRRTLAELRVLGGALGQAAAPMQARVLLNDISPKGIGLFCPVKFQAGQEVAITLQDPRRIYLKGRIVWCQSQEPESHIISEKTFSFRVGIQFLVESEEQQADLERYCQELAHAYLLTPKPAA